MKASSKFLFLVIFMAFVFSPYSDLFSEDKKVECKDKLFTCAGCGTHVTKEAAKFKVEYKGKTYYLASEKCKEAFEKDPEKFLKGCKHGTTYVCPVSECTYTSDKPGQCPHCKKELQKKEIKCTCHQTAYVCPMAECKYKTDKPGKCPKCGMDLKKVEHACCIVTADHAHKCKMHDEGKEMKKCPHKKMEK